MLDFKKEEGKLLFSFKNYLIIIIIAIILAVLFYFFFLKLTICRDFACYQDALVTCKKSEFVREDDNTIWRYVIKKSVDKNTCLVEVTLLALKEGNVDMEKLQGQSMECSVLRSSGGFPENDLASCSGKLKEGIQDVLIQRMHNYLIKNLGQIQEEFVGV
ncbi:MAG: hypothetical protein RL557_329 [archaeon]|jgi:hypothetical protein